MLITRKLKIEKLVFELSEDEAREFARVLLIHLPAEPCPTDMFAHRFMHEIISMLEV